MRVLVVGGPASLPAALLAALSLAACQPVGTPGSTPVPNTAQAVEAIADTAAQVADALHVAPPPFLDHTTIDDVAVNRAFKAFDLALDLIDGLRDAGVLVPGTPRALAVKRGILFTQGFLNAASAAQQAGSAATYSSALAQAKTALGDIQSALAKGDRP